MYVASASLSIALSEDKIDRSSLYRWNGELGSIIMALHAFAFGGFFFGCVFFLGDGDLLLGL